MRRLSLAAAVLLLACTVSAARNLTDFHARSLKVGCFTPRTTVRASLPAGHHIRHPQMGRRQLPLLLLPPCRPPPTSILRVEKARRSRRVALRAAQLGLPAAAAAAAAPPLLPRPLFLPCCYHCRRCLGQPALQHCGPVHDPFQPDEGKFKRVGLTVAGMAEPRPVARPLGSPCSRIAGTPSPAAHHPCPTSTHLLPSCCRTARWWAGAPCPASTALAPRCATP